MPPTSTPRLQLSKPDPDDFVNVLLDLDANYDKIDALGKNPVGVPFAPVKKNSADTPTSATFIMCETGTGNFKQNRWYYVEWRFRSHTSIAAGGTPNGTAAIRLISGGVGAITDPDIADTTILNTSVADPSTIVHTTFDVPSDGAYTLSCTANSGGANTVTILASAGVGNAGHDRVLFVMDLGEK